MVEAQLYDHTHEDAVIGAMLHCPEWAETVKLTCPPGQFFSIFARRAYEAILAANDRGKEFDAREVAALMAATAEGDKMGGIEAITDQLARLASAYPAGGDPEFWAGRYVNTIRLDHCRRKVVAAAVEAKALASGGRVPQSDLLAIFGSVMREVEDGVTGAHDKSALEILREVSGVREAGGDPRVSTGYAGLDCHGAFVESGLYVIAARTGEGKSSFTANLAARMSKSKIPFGLITVEMTARQMVNSIIGVASGIDRSRLMRNKLTPAEAAEVAESEQALAGAWRIADREGMTAEDIATLARVWKRRGGIKVLLVDHLQRIKATDASQPRHLQVGHITWSLKGLARQLGIVVVLAVQINREGAREGAPKLHHLKESGSVEEDADGVIAIYVDRSKNDLKALTWDAELWWLKNRHGSIGTCPIVFEKASGRINERAPQFGV